jgi:hypothetical protein
MRIARRTMGIAATIVVVVGTTGAVSYQQKKEYSGQEAAAQQAAGSDLVSQLQQAADLHAAGMLTDKEFTGARQKILVSG